MDRIKTRKHIILLATALLLAWPPGALHAGQMDLAPGHIQALNAWPGADGLIRTADDLVSDVLSPMNNSAPNASAALSYNAFDFGSGLTETGYLPAGMNAVTFLEGTVDVNVTALTAGSGPVINGWDVSGTLPFPTHGPYSSQITAVNSGDYTVATGAFTLNVDFTASLNSGSADAQSLDLSGLALYRAAADFGTPTGNTYFDTVLIPLAQDFDADSLFFIHGTGIVPASTGGSGGYFPQMPIEAVIVGLGGTTSPTTETSWGQIKSLYAD